MILHCSLQVRSDPSLRRRRQLFQKRSCFVLSPPFFHRDFWPVLEERSFSTYTYKLSHFVARRCTCMKTMIRYRVRIFGFCKKSLDVFRILRIQAILSWRVWVVHRMRDLAGSLAQVRTLSPVARDASIHFLLSDSSD